MGRSVEQEDYIKKYREERINKNEEVLKNNDEEIRAEYFLILDNLIQEQLKCQNKNEQNKIKHISLCRLLSSSYTESYESYLWISNSQLYYDNNKSYTYWKPSFIYDSLDKDMIEVERLLRKKFIHIEAYELFILKKKLILDDWISFKKLFCNLAKESKQSIINSSLQVEDEILILYGDYMERLEVIGRIEIIEGGGHE